ncbi:MAG TPA: DEAD/DEAH box helicase family protein [Ktedonobacteraceae bacterium]
MDIAERENAALLPVRLYLTPDLDSVALARTLKFPHDAVRFSKHVQGRFDAALVPTGKTNGPLDRFLLVIEASLPQRDQVALYAHAIGHLLLNEQRQALDRSPNLDPDSGNTHVDRLAELRYVETLSNRTIADREVLETFPLLAELAEPLPESRSVIEEATRELLKRLEELGWLKRNELQVSPYTYTDGRVLTASARRGKRYSIDLLLRASFSLPIAAVHAQRAAQTYDDGMHRVQDAALRLGVPFAYLVTTSGEVHEFAYTRGNPPPRQVLPELPAHDELVKRWLTDLGLTTTDEKHILFQPYMQTKIPRYYQDTAINQALIAILRARRGLREPRILLTLATGTGKTRVAFQLLWKLKQSNAVRKVLFLADRGYLLDQAIGNDFAPFKDAIWRGLGESKASRDIVFASYQWLTTTTQDGRYHYEDYEPDFFDVIIIDECHRGSASEDSKWRQVLEYFKAAIQVGLTATPLKSRDVQTSQYFGDAVYTYSLSRGINDGFLAPYRVRRILIGPGSQQATAASAPTTPTAPMADTAALIQDVEANAELAEALVMETSRTMRAYTRAIAEHLANYLQASDPRAKTIVFCVDNEHAQEMRDALRKACAAWLRPENIVRIVDKDGAEGEKALYNFCSTVEQRPLLVTTSKLLSTGIDAPTCKNIVLARGVGSMVEFKQIIGRGTRLSGSAKTWFTILDYAGAMKHFFDPEFDGNPEFIVTELPQATPEGSAQAENAGADSGEQAGQTAQAEVSEAESAVSLSQGEPSPVAAVEPVAATPEIPEANQAYAYEIAPPATADDAVDEEVLENEVDDEAGLYTSGRPPDPPAAGKHVTKERRDKMQEGASSSSEQEGATSGSAALSDAQAQGEQPGPGRRLSSAEIAQGDVVKEDEDGNRYVAIGERIFELGPDSNTLRSGTGQQWAKLALQEIVHTPEELRARWLDPERRRDLVDTLDEQAVPLETLTGLLHLEEMDPFDVLLHALFAQPALTRAGRVKRLREEQGSFFARFAANPLAVGALDALLAWYVSIPLAELEHASELNISNIDLLTLPPLKSLGMPMDISLAFRACGTHIEEALEELQALLYSV